jgi:hypothetical protein
MPKDKSEQNQQGRRFPPALIFAQVCFFFIHVGPAVKIALLLLEVFPNEL